MIDLHIHTNCSDGSYSVKDIMTMYKNNNFNVISITDHDTFSSQYEALVESKASNIKYIYGIEMTVYYNKTSVHILGYFNQIPAEEFQKFIKNNVIINTIKNNRKKLRERSNIGYYTLEEAINLIHQHKGIAILAHPILYEKNICHLVKLVDGIECIHPLHSLEFTKYLLEVCNNNALYCSAGTDLHEESDIPYIDNHVKLCKEYYNYLEPLIKTLL